MLASGDFNHGDFLQTLTIGEKRGKQETAKALLKMKLGNIEQIAQASGLSIDEVKTTC